ncbi:hypothetical protein [Limosilactobacillus agrestis]|uniref:hypothetical protein n=1 Tax=Limosilactobacillus agrestis TaxID=2759748 RepID=UPI001E38FE8E|nr:hypothetical protein [Limosilactobacillus agrestis]MCD7113374.1 hypothetical protein [Limosilactobacillus agrestis]
MNKEHGQVTGIIWRGPDDLAVYQRLKNPNWLSSLFHDRILIEQKIKGEFT